MPGYPIAPDTNPVGPEVTFETQSIFPPAAVYVGPDDNLVLLVRDPLSTLTIQLSYRLLNPQGVIIPNQEVFNLVGSGAATQQFIISPAEGFLLSATLFAPAVSRGECFVKFYLQRGTDPTQPNLSALLIQGYLSADDRLSFPQSQTESSLSGRGNTRPLVFANPAPGANFSNALPAGVNWRFKSIICQLVTSAAVANRVPKLAIAPSGASTAILSPMPAAVTAGQTVNLCWGEGMSPLSAGSNQVGSIPADTLLQSLSVFAIDVDLMQGADQLQNIEILVEEFVGP